MATQEEKAQTLASYFIGGYGGVHQLSHRLSLLSFWSIKPGSRILELGCGQGECTVALADAVGPDGHIDAVDPGSPDYGTVPLKISLNISTPPSKTPTNTIQAPHTRSPNPNPTSPPVPSDLV